MEDVDIMLRIRQKGHRIRFISDPVVTSAEATTRGSLRYLKTEGVSYVVSQESDDVTIIWLMDGSAGGGV